MRYLLLLITLFTNGYLRAQNDSTLLLEPEHLTEKNIIPRDIELQKTKALSATRTLEDIDQLPYTVWVVTAADILENGYVTLGDVLKAVPGIRVSQPGNALEGETFMMRGLEGNRYVKILINDVPVRPMFAPGMPIGAQLPIRQAERIEVLYGPAGAIYGNEAFAGVVNIILKETERPIFTQADLSFGRFGYNSLDLMFGGKLGKDKKVFRFSLYGSSTIRETTDVYYDQNLYNVENYLPFDASSNVYVGNPNFRASLDSFKYAKTAQLSHESRLFGVNLTWRGLHFTYHRMARFDASALGLSPLAVSYSNPSDRMAERIETYTLGFNKTRKRWLTHNNISLNRYNIDNASTTTYVFDRLSAAAYYAQSIVIPVDSPRTQIIQDARNRFASNERYTAASAIDVRFESRINASLMTNLSLDAGFQGTASFGFAPLTYHSFPVEIKAFDFEGRAAGYPFIPLQFSIGEANLFGQLAWRSKKLTIIGGNAFNFSSEGAIKSLPRLGIFYRFDSTWTVRANYATGLRRSPPYENANTFEFVAGSQIEPYANVGNFTETETMQSLETALRYQSDNFRAEGIFFYEQADNLLRPGYLTPSDNFVPSWNYGYKNAPGKALSMWGIQGLLRSENFSVDLKSRKTGKRVATWYAEFFMQYSRGKEWFGEPYQPTADVRNAPRWMTQFRTNWRTGKFQLMLASNRQKNTLSSAVVYKDFYNRKTVIEQYPVFRTWDMMMRLYLSNHFLVYFHLQNMFNRRYAGIDASGTPDDLLYNPQQGRTFRLGVNYNMN